MACLLTTSFALDCKDSIGGVKNIWVIANTQKGTITKSASGTVTAWAPTANSIFKYELIKNTSMLEVDATANPVAGTVHYPGKLNIKMRKMDVYKRNELKLLAHNLLIFIVLDRNGVYYVVGEDSGCDMVMGKGSTGTAMGDFNGYDLDFTFDEPDMPLVLAAGVAASLGLV